MTGWQGFFSTVSAVILFLFSLQSLSHELQTGGGYALRAWLVPFKLTDIGLYFIVAGALISILPFRFSFLGKSVFYLLDNVGPFISARFQPRPEYSEL